MNVAITFDYITSEWVVIYQETDKVHLVGKGRTLEYALDDLTKGATWGRSLKPQIKLWFGITS